MYTKERNNGRLLNFILGIIAIMIIIFVIIWIINKGHTTSRNTKMFNNNLNNMQITANDYFKKNLPENIGESYKVSLKEMYALGLSDKLYYGNDACDADESYIIVTKTGENEYKISSTLVCSDKKDSKIETIKVNDNKSNTNTNTNTVVDNTTTNTTTNTNTNTNKNNTACPSKCTVDAGCDITIDDSNCTMVYEYQYVKKTYSCPEGTVLTNDGRCAKTTAEKVNPKATSTNTVTNAKKAEDTYVKVYTPAEKVDGTETKYCVNGELKNGACYEYANKVKNTTYTYSCPEGYTPSGSGENTKCTKKDPVNADPIKTYTAWGNPDKVYDLDYKINVYEKELEKLIQTGSTCKTLFGTTTCIYSYEHYSRKAKYSCPSSEYTANGSGANMTCVKYVTTTVKANKEVKESYSCPDGYKDGGTKCYKTYVASVYKTPDTYSCPTQTTPEGSGANLKCYVMKPVYGEYYCENSKATLTSDHKCVISNPTTYTCPSNDYTLNSENKCVRTTTEYVPMVVSGSKYIYSTLTSVEGYTRTGKYKYTYDCIHEVK